MLQDSQKVHLQFLKHQIPTRKYRIKTIYKRDSLHQYSAPA